MPRWHQEPSALVALLTCPTRCESLVSSALCHDFLGLVRLTVLRSKVQGIRLDVAASATRQSRLEPPERKCQGPTDKQVVRGSDHEPALILCIRNSRSKALSAHLQALSLALAE